MKPTFVVDANHWVYYLDDQTSPHARVAPKLDALLDSEDLLQTTVIQLEFLHYAARRWGPEAAGPVGLFLGFPATVVPLVEHDIAGAFRLLGAQGRDGLGGRDASVLLAALHHGASLLCTNDKALARAARKEGIDVRDLTAR